MSIQIRKSPPPSDAVAQTLSVQKIKPRIASSHPRSRRDRHSRLQPKSISASAQSIPDQLAGPIVTKTPRLLVSLRWLLLLLRRIPALHLPDPIRVRSRENLDIVGPSVRAPLHHLVSLLAANSLLLGKPRRQQPSNDEDHDDDGFHQELHEALGPHTHVSEVEHAPLRRERDGDRVGYSHEQEG